MDLNNTNFYFNSSYKGNFGGNWQLFTGLSYGYGQNKIGIDSNDVNNNEHASHLKLKLTKKLTEKVKLAFGSDYFITKFDEDFNTTFSNGYDATIAAVYTEADIFFSKKFAAKLC